MSGLAIDCPWGSHGWRQVGEGPPGGDSPGGGGAPRAQGAVERGQKILGPRCKKGRGLRKRSSAAGEQPTNRRGIGHVRGLPSFQGSFQGKKEAQETPPGSRRRSRLGCLSPVFQEPGCSCQSSRRPESGHWLCPQSAASGRNTTGVRRSRCIQEVREIRPESRHLTAPLRQAKQVTNAKRLGAK